MKHFMLKFTHGVEIGAHLAYIGHYKRTRDQAVWQIALDELEHRRNVVSILGYYQEVPNQYINQAFESIGTIIMRLCAISPIFLLNIVARSLEVFAVFSYDRLAKMYPEHSTILTEMAIKEKEHELYFKGA